MSGLKSTRGQRLMGKIGAAAVIATLTGSGVALAGPPHPQALNNDPNVHWFAAWDEPPQHSADFFPTPTSYLGIGAAQAEYNLPVNAAKPLGLKVEVPLSSAQAASLFNTKYAPTQKAISYVFADFEMADKNVVIANVANLVKQVRGSQWSKEAYIGQYGLSPVGLAEDKFRRQPGVAGPNQGSQHQFFTKKDYEIKGKEGVNMSNESLYPGEADFRNKSTFDWANSNIRTGLFVAPIGSFSQIQEVLNKDYHGDKDDFLKTDGKDKHKNIPWVARFNNSGNKSLDTDNNTTNGYRFVPGQALPQAGLSGAQTANQMMGRGDFSAQILHYRMRGAYSVNLFHEGGAQGSVVGYSSAMAKQDVRDGWYNHSWNGRTNAIFNDKDNKAATLTLNPIIDGTAGATGNRSEQTGTIWSGEYSLKVANATSFEGKGALDVLASNLDTTNHLIKFGTVDVYDVFCVKNAQGYTYADGGNLLAPSRNYLIQAGLHKLLQFDLVKTRVYNTEADYNALNNKYSIKTIWLLNSQYSVFTNNNRNEIGIPEPTAFGALAAAGTFAAVSRRQRRKA